VTTGAKGLPITQATMLVAFAQPVHYNIVRHRYTILWLLLV
jgi:hypothetical protein